MKKPMIKLEIELSKTLPKFDFMKNTCGIAKVGIIILVIVNAIGIFKNGIAKCMPAIVASLIAIVAILSLEMLYFALSEHERQNFDLGKYLAELEKRADFE